jgi:hypothetical protein
MITHEREAEEGAEHGRGWQYEEVDPLSQGIRGNNLSSEESRSPERQPARVRLLYNQNTSRAGECQQRLKFLSLSTQTSKHKTRIDLSPSAPSLSLSSLTTLGQSESRDVNRLAKERACRNRLSSGCLLLSGPARPSSHLSFPISDRTCQA